MWPELAGTAAGAAAGLLAWGARWRSATLFAPSVWRGPRDRPALALTFDDGPSEATLRLLELLARHRARATFFQCGLNVERLPQVARGVAAAGHETGNHGYAHQRLWLRSPRFIREDLARAQAVIAETTGVRPTLFRAPYGVRWFGMRAAQRRLNLLGVMWTATARDWKLPAAGIAARLLGAAANGAIFCLHDGRGVEPNPDVSAMLEALDRLLPALRQRGFSLQTVSGLLGLSSRAAERSGSR